VTTTDAIKVLVQHIAECLGKDSSQRNEKHNQMLELIVYLIRNLLAIPDRRRQGVRGNSGVSVFDAKEDHMKDLHSSFLHKLRGYCVHVLGFHDPDDEQAESMLVGNLLSYFPYVFAD